MDTKRSVSLLLCVAAVLFTSIQAQAQSFIPIRINSAGGAYTDSQGRAWSADYAFSGGTAARVSDPITNTVEDVLYRSERWGSFSYRLTVPAGVYQVTLKFAETYFSRSGQRRFNVAINGTTVLADFDILAEAGGPNIALDRTFTASVGGGTGNLLIQFLHMPGQPDDPKVDAIEVVSAENAAPPGNATTRLLRADPTTLSFGGIDVGGSGILSSVLTNVGNSNVTVSGVSVSGAGFDVSGISTGQVLLPGEKAALNVTLAPALIGAVVGNAVVSSDATNSPTVVSFSGIGVRLTSHAATLQWDASTSAVSGYYVYSSTISGGPYTRQTSSPLANTSYRDTTVQSGQTYYYVVTSVDASGIESSYSNQASALIP